MIISLKCVPLQEKQFTNDGEGVPDEEGWITVSRSKGVANTQVNDERVKRKLKKRNKEKVQVTNLFR